MFKRKGACDIADLEARRIVKERYIDDRHQLLGQGVRLIEDIGRSHGSDFDGQQVIIQFPSIYEISTGPNIIG